MLNWPGDQSDISGASYNDNNDKTNMFGSSLPGGSSLTTMRTMRK